SAMVRSVIIDQARPNRPGTTTDLPAFLLVIGLIALANPARTALGFPAAGRTRRERITIGALGSAGAAGAVVGLAAVAGPLPGGPHISPPTARIAAALVVVVTGVLDLLGRVPSPEPGLPGLGGALVPVFVPLVLRPALALMAVSVAADHGVAAVTIA